MIKVVFTGGPSGGKTTVANSIQKELAAQVVKVPEAASMIFAGGFPRRLTPETRRYQQRAIYYVQRELEGLFSQENPQKLLLCDRGSLDGVAYWPLQAQGFLECVGSNLNAEIARYDWVLHLDTAGMESYGEDPLRIESYNQALEINSRIRDAWSMHPRRFIIPSTNHFMEKLEMATNIIKAILSGADFAHIQKQISN